MKYFALLLTLLIFTSCELIFPDPPEPELPPITTTGENTFGAIVNGEIRSTSSAFFITALHPRDSILQFVGQMEGISSEERLNLGFDISGIKVEEREYESNEFKGRPYLIFFFNDNIEGCKLDPADDEEITFNGILNIIYKDPVKQIMSGTFEYTINKPGCSEIKVTDGRFDVRYRI